MKMNHFNENKLTTVEIILNGGQKKNMLKIRQHKQLSIGLHNVNIKDIRIARKFNKDNSLEIIANQNTGEIRAIEVVFQSIEKRKLYSGIFWLSESGRWTIDALCKAVKVNNTNRSPDKNELIGKRLYIIVAGVYKVINGIRIIPNYDTQLVYKFFEDNGSRPQLTGDPVFGEPGRYFVVEKIINTPVNHITGNTIIPDENFTERSFGDD